MIQRTTMKIKQSKKAKAIMPATGRIRRLAKHIEKKADGSVVLKITKDADTFLQANPVGKAAWMRNAVEQLKKETSANMTREILEACGRRLKFVNSHTIIGGYDHCYCGQVEHTKELFTDTTYCNCSVGWYKQLFETAMGKKVEVKILQSIISRSKSCA